MSDTFEKAYLPEIITEFTKYKKMGDACIDRLSAEQLHYQPDEDTNSMALLVKHMSGNMKSRWTDFLTTDGEKPNRHRDTEFEGGKETKEEIIRLWEEGWAVMFDTLRRLSENDIMATVYIRKEPHTVFKAITRQTTHYAYHVGQMVFLAKIILKKEWKSLSIPKGRSEEFNREMTKNP